MVCRISSLPRSVSWYPRPRPCRTRPRAYKVAVKAVDKAAAKGLLHKNNAAHKKSSMTIKLSKLA